MEPPGMETIILRRQEEVLEQDKNAAVQETNLLLDIGLAKICGEDRVETRDAHRPELEENIESLFIFFHFRAVQSLSNPF
jgi:hypothetical protein